jgi:hypothetical protein
MLAVTDRKGLEFAGAPKAKYPSCTLLYIILSNKTLTPGQNAREGIF